MYSFITFILLRLYAGAGEGCMIYYVYGVAIKVIYTYYIYLYVPSHNKHEAPAMATAMATNKSVLMLVELKMIIQ